MLCFYNLYIVYSRKGRQIFSWNYINLYSTILHNPITRGHYLRYLLRFQVLKLFLASTTSWIFLFKAFWTRQRLYSLWWWLLLFECWWYKWLIWQRIYIHSFFNSFLRTFSFLSWNYNWLSFIWTWRRTHACIVWKIREL